MIYIMNYNLSWYICNYEFKSNIFFFISFYFIDKQDNILSNLHYLKHLLINKKYASINNDVFTPPPELV
jgi:hypothetical protein